MNQESILRLEKFSKVLGCLNEDFNVNTKIKTGVDLGTSNICIVVLDENNNPITGEIKSASVVKDGLVVNYVEAVAIVNELKDRIEKRLGISLSHSAAAIPPGTVGKSALIVKNVIETCGINVNNLVDEPEAAAFAIDVKEGAVVDVGGGTTGISIIKDGKVISSYDEPTGGTHMSLVIAGNRQISFEDAEEFKLDQSNSRYIFPMVKPVIEKMAFIVRNFIKDFDVNDVYITGGASTIEEFQSVFSKEIDKNIIRPKHGLYITPVGIAMFCKDY